MPTGNGGYTAVLCGAPPCLEHAADEVAESVRRCVRRSWHGVLVRAGCTLGATACRLRPAGPLVLVQPCDAKQRPTGYAIRVGPLCTVADVRALSAWLLVGDLDPTRLPAHLVATHRTVRSAARN